jgi:hypothetical protein
LACTILLVRRPLYSVHQHQRHERRPVCAPEWMYVRLVLGSALRRHRHRSSLTSVTSREPFIDCLSPSLSMGIFLHCSFTFRAHFSALYAVLFHCVSGQCTGALQKCSFVDFLSSPLSARIFLHCTQSCLVAYQDGARVTHYRIMKEAATGRVRLQGPDGTKSDTYESVDQLLTAYKIPQVRLSHSSNARHCGHIGHSIDVTLCACPPTQTNPPANAHLNFPVCSLPSSLLSTRYPHTACIFPLAGDAEPSSYWDLCPARCDRDMVWRWCG